jgi:polyisoprenoid-binding protein YceI
MSHLLRLCLLTLGLTGLANAQEAAPAAPAAPAAAPVSYKLDNVKSSLIVKVFKDPTTLAAGLSHDHAVKATKWTGAVTWDAANPAACKIDFTVPVKDLDPDPPEARQRAGLTGTLDDGMRAEVKEHILGDDQLEASKYPTITFKSTSCAAASGKINVTGTFTMHGKSKTLTAPFTVQADGTTFTGKGTFRLKQTDFGFQPFTALLGQLKNQDGIEFMVDVTGTKG